MLVKGAADGLFGQVLYGSGNRCKAMTDVTSMLKMLTTTICMFLVVFGMYLRNNFYTYIAIGHGLPGDLLHFMLFLFRPITLFLCICMLKEHDQLEVSVSIRGVRNIWSSDAPTGPAIVFN